MRYYKTIVDDIIIMVGIGDGGEEITQEEYNGILSAISDKPEETESTGYKLKTDLTWEAYEKPAPDPDPEAETTEIIEALEGIL